MDVNHPDTCRLTRLLLAGGIERVVVSELVVEFDAQAAVEQGGDYAGEPGPDRRAPRSADRTPMETLETRLNEVVQRHHPRSLHAGPTGDMEPPARDQGELVQREGREDGEGVWSKNSNVADVTCYAPTPGSNFGRAALLRRDPQVPTGEQLSPRLSFWTLRG
jgi:hypothetical protein